MTPRPPRYCADCGARLVRQWIGRERRYRRVCRQCRAVAYQNPKVLVTTIVTCQEKVLLCLRADRPARNRWTAPTGFVECGETLEEAAAREIREETQVAIRPADLSLYAVSTLPDISQIYVSFRAAVPDPAVGCGPECNDVRYFAEDEFPWDRLAYPPMIGFFRLFFRERRTGAFSVHLTRVDARRILRRSYRIVSAEELVERRRGSRGSGRL